MAQKAREAVVEPEVALARRLVERYRLTPPIDVEALVRIYADLEFDNIPEGIDAICVGLKSPGRRPLVILDNNKSERRKRFTLAHELGHLVIPWHAGLIIDEIHLFETNPEDAYVEAEANRFASELLAPSKWLRANFNFSHAAVAQRAISERANISVPAAFIRLAAAGPSGLVYAKELNGSFVNVGRTKGTVAAPPAIGARYNVSDFAIATHSQTSHGDYIYHWWSFDDDAEGFEFIEGLDWKAILTEMISVLRLDLEQEKKFKQSLNGLMASVNSQLKDGRSESKLYNRICQRLHSARLQDDRIGAIVDHPNFQQFVSARVTAFLS